MNDPKFPTRNPGPEIAYLAPTGDSGAIPVPFPVDPTPDETAKHYWLCLASGETTDQYLARLRDLELRGDDLPPPWPPSSSMGVMQQPAARFQTQDPSTPSAAGSGVDVESIRKIANDFMTLFQRQDHETDNTDAATSRDDKNGWGR